MNPKQLFLFPRDEKLFTKIALLDKGQTSLGAVVLWPLSLWSVPLKGIVNTKKTRMNKLRKDLQLLRLRIRVDGLERANQFHLGTWCVCKEMFGQR
jgi:hypothetical protein